MDRILFQAAIDENRTAAWLKWLRENGVHEEVAGAAGRLRHIFDAGWTAGAFFGHDQAAATVKRNMAKRKK